MVPKTVVFKRSTKYTTPYRQAFCNHTANIRIRCGLSSLADRVQMWTWLAMARCPLRVIVYPLPSVSLSQRRTVLARYLAAHTEFLADQCTLQAAECVH